MAPSTQSAELESVKTRLKHIWMAGDYDRFLPDMEGSARELYDCLNVAPGCQLLDVGCGSGQLALIAAKDRLEVTGIDIASNLAAALRTGWAITPPTHAMKGARAERSTELLSRLFCRSPCLSPRTELKRYLSADRHFSKLTHH